MFFEIDESKSVPNVTKAMSGRMVASGENRDTNARFAEQHLVSEQIQKEARNFGKNMLTTSKHIKN